MSQISLLIIELIACYVILLISYKMYNNIGIYTYSIIAIILASIMSQKLITLYNFDINLGIIPLISIFTASNILIQKNGKEDAKTLLLITIATSIIGFIILYIISLMQPSSINLFMSASFDNIFNNAIRIYFATFVATLYSLLLNMNLYYYLKKIKNNILISNLFSTIIIHFISSILFGLIAYIFTKDPIEIAKIITIRYLVCLFVGIISTVIIYITKIIKINEK